MWTLAVDDVTDRIGVNGALIGAWMFDALGGQFGGRGFTVHVATWLVALFVGRQVVGIAASYPCHAADRRPSRELRDLTRLRKRVAWSERGPSEHFRWASGCTLAVISMPVQHASPTGGQEAPPGTLRCGAATVRGGRYRLMEDPPLAYR